LTDTLVRVEPVTAGAIAPPVVVATRLRKRYHISRAPREVLGRVSLTVQSREFVAIMGPSGCGKSTLLHVLGGLEPPDEGTVLIDGHDLYAMDDAALSRFRRDQIGVVFQFFNLIPSLTAAENVALPLRLRSGRFDGRGRQAIRARVGVLMDMLDLHGLQGHGPEEISGGEQQRIAVARALAAAPTLLLADEPTGNLDYAAAQEVMRLLSRLCRSEHQTTVVVTHDARTAAYADRVLVMCDGVVVDEVCLEHPAGGPDGAPDARPLIERLGALGL
jgi:putative ABC transport system ATP-binding protein